MLLHEVVPLPLGQEGHKVLHKPCLPHDDRDVEVEWLSAGKATPCRPIGTHHEARGRGVLPPVRPRLWLGLEELGVEMGKARAIHQCIA
ncbi:hypothetical protein [Porphyromonas sp. COT-239 OH1446]|uniref:hypothetical protein n=1 Tax=Porphyromonas sp. COT-239 OH1446 TaxID=1515613 RepID=UPI00052DA652|nr:hypothetical protein [Porphyromonas sp. COT-239 OH1446]KGN69881.1 hypothetical protein HQ37_05090 [Porphyromonas sp. COT-239 OH1446]